MIVRKRASGRLRYKVFPALAAGVGNTQNSLTGQPNKHLLDWRISTDASKLFYRVWTALHRGVHSRDFMFKALKDSRQGMEIAHDVYCSECGTLTAARLTHNSEGGADDIFLAGESPTSTR